MSSSTNEIRRDWRERTVSMLYDSSTFFVRKEPASVFVLFSPSLRLHQKSSIFDFLHPPSRSSSIQLQAVQYLEAHEHYPELPHPNDGVLPPR